MKKLTVALLMGGVSAEREVSLASGREVLKALKKLGHRVSVYDPKTINFTELFHDTSCTKIDSDEFYRPAAAFVNVKIQDIVCQRSKSY